MSTLALASAQATLAFSRVLRPHSLKMQRVMPHRHALRVSRGLLMPSRALTVSTRAMASDLVSAIQKKNKSSPVVLYSKTYCPYCAEVKSLFQGLHVDAKVIELDDLADGADVQAALATLVGRRTVPQVFVGGHHIGGCDDTMAAQASGKLKELLAEAGVSVA